MAHPAVHSRGENLLIFEVRLQASRGENLLGTTVSLALLATSASNQYTPMAPGGIIAWVICNGRKKQQIGGWLLYYYWQLYAGALMSAAFFGIALQSYVPENFDDKSRYALFLTSTVPLLIVFAFQIAVGTFLISVRTWDLLRLLRWLMMAEIGASVIGVAIDSKYFPDNVGLDFFTLIPAILWLAYFFKSKRVAHVFKLHDWDEAVKTIYPSAVTTAT